MVAHDPHTAAGRSTRASGRLLRDWKVLAGAALMAAAGALAGAELRPEDLEVRTARAPHLRVSGPGGKAGVTIP
jgi:hypothetical protein